MHDAQRIRPAALGAVAARRVLAGRGIYARLVEYARPHRAAMAAAVAASAASAGAAALYAYLLGPLLRAVVTRGPAPLAGGRIDRGRLTLVVPALLVALAAFKAATQLLQGGLMQGAGQKVMSRVRADVYRHLLDLPPRFFEKRHSGELLSRFSSDVAQVEFAVTQAFSSYAKDALQLAALLLVCLMLDARLFAAAVLLIPTAAFAVSRFARSMRASALHTSSRLGKLTQLLAEQLQNLPIIQSYRALPQMLARFDEEQSAYLAEMRRSLFVRGIFTPTLEFLGVLAVSGLVGLGTLAVAAEPDLAAKLLSFTAAALLMYQPLKSLSGNFSSVVQGVGSAERLLEIVDQPPSPDVGLDARPLKEGLTLENVRASHDGVTDALRGVSLTIPAGRRVALVGASGAGKSTMFSILLRFLDPSGGRVSWDGVELTRLRPSSLRAQVAWVPQEPILFSATVRENLLFAQPGASEPELWEALCLAHAHDFVRALPGGLDEVVGERGGTLSGGQRQRLAIARAFLRRPSLLLLDEPTSALDAVAEREVEAGLGELMRGRTTMVIAHRLSTVRGADIIYVLDRGELVERGTHAELVSRQGRYAALLQHGEVA